VTDQQSFIVLVEPIIPTCQPESVRDFPIISDSFRAQLVFTWTTLAIQGRVVSSYTVPLEPPNFQDMIISIQVQPYVLLNEYFTISVTIINLSDSKRELRLIIPASNWSSFDSFHPIIKPTLEDLRKDQEEKMELEKIEREQKKANSKEVYHLKDNSFLKNQNEDEIKFVKPKVTTPVDLFDSKHSMLPVICTEHTIYVGKVKPKSSISSNLKFLALREGIFHLEKLKVYDIISQQLYTVIESCPIYVREIPK
jgi:hypothetical protein